MSYFCLGVPSCVCDYCIRLRLHESDAVRAWYYQSILDKTMPVCTYEKRVEAAREAVATQVVERRAPPATAPRQAPAALLLAAAWEPPPAPAVPERAPAPAVASPKKPEEVKVDRFELIEMD